MPGRRPSCCRADCHNVKSCIAEHIAILFGCAAHVPSRLLHGVLRKCLGLCIICIA